MPGGHPVHGRGVDTRQPADPTSVQSPQRERRPLDGGRTHHGRAEDPVVSSARTSPYLSNGPLSSPRVKWARRRWCLGGALARSMGGCCARGRPALLWSAIRVGSGSAT